METETIEITPNQMQLIYVLQNGYGYWSKGLTFEDAQKNFAKQIKGRGASHKPKHLSIYLVKGDELSESEAFSEIQVSWSNITYKTDKVILLSETTIK